MVVTPPKRVETAVEGLEQALNLTFEKTLESTAIASLAPRVTVYDISDLDITSPKVHSEFTDVSGHGVIEVNLCRSESEATTYDAFPFAFAITINSQQEVVNIRTLEVDTRSFYQ